MESGRESSEIFPTKDFILHIFGEKILIKFFQTKELFTPKDDLHDFLREYSHATGSFLNRRFSFSSKFCGKKKICLASLLNYITAYCMSAKKTHDL